MATIKAGRAFEHLGKRVTITDADGTTLGGRLGSVKAEHATRGVPDVELVIGGYEIYTNSEWPLEVEDD